MDGAVNETTRRSWHCGWMDKRDWIGDRPNVPQAFGDEPYEEDVCPGYLINRPLIGEIVIAHRSFDKGNWDAMYPDAANALCEGVEIFSGVLDTYRAWLIRKEREEAERKRASRG